MKLRGIIPPVVTPMTADQDVDLPGLRKHIDFMLAKGVHGIFVLGTTGEFYALDDTEKQTIVADAISHVAGRSPVYAGTGAETTREVIRVTQMAEKEGARASASSRRTSSSRIRPSYSITLEGSRRAPHCRSCCTTTRPPAAG